MSALRVYLPCSAKNPTCQQCGLYKGCNSPFMRGDVQEDATQQPIMFIGEAPGYNEDRHGQPFVGDAGKLLYATAGEVGIPLEQVYTTNAVRCRPPNNKLSGNKEINYCREFLLQEIASVRPRAILLLGASALKAVTGKSGLGTHRFTLMKHTLPAGKQVPISVAYHPAYVLRNRNELASFTADLEFFNNTVLKGKAGDGSMPKMKLNANPTAKDLKLLLDDVRSRDSFVAVDFETTSLEPLSDPNFKLLCLGFSNGEKCLVVDFRDETNLTNAAVRQMAALALASKQVKKVAHNAKYEEHCAEAALGVKVQNIYADTMLLHCTLFPGDGKHDLDTVSAEMLGVPKYKGMLDPYFKKGKKKDFSAVPYPVLAEYNGWDCHVAWHAANKMLPMLREEAQRYAPSEQLPVAMSTYGVFHRLLMPSMRSLSTVESRGMRVDVGYLDQLDAEYSHLFEGAMKTIRGLTKVSTFESKARAAVYKELAGNTRVRPTTIQKRIEAANFNPSSVPQVRELLYGPHYYALQPYEKQRTKGGEIAVGAEWLDKILEEAKADLSEEEYAANEAVQFIEHFKLYSKLKKLHGTYIRGVKKRLDKNRCVHTSFNLHVARTGRLSSSNPNLQNIPNDKKYGPAIRRMFIPRKGMAIIEADYSQIELRVQAAYANDKNMLGVFRAGDDIHDKTARWMFKIPSSGTVDSDQRRAAKVVNFGIIYGMGPEALVGATGYPYEDCKKFIQAWFDLYADVAPWQREVEEYAQKHGRVYTMFGRFRLVENARIKERTEEDRILLSRARRIAVNTPIQGTASDFGLTSLNRVEREAPTLSFTLDVLSLVHDSLVVETERENADEASAYLIGVMRKEPLRWVGRYMRGCPVDVEAKHSAFSWAHAA